MTLMANSILLTSCDARRIVTVEVNVPAVVTEGSGGSGGMDGGGAVSTNAIRKLDLLFVIDNSRSMADKQLILSFAVPDLVRSLVNPLCLDPDGAPTALQPSGPLDPCPVAGTEREFPPVVDLHIGVISSSLGGHGADACPDAYSGPPCSPKLSYSNNDKGHLITRVDECGGGDVATWQSKGFLAWDPEQQLTPPGEGDTNNLAKSLHAIVTGAGQIGCGYESQLESWYRFLVDPEPYQTISVINGAATPQGVDDTLLKQRTDFLRPDSLLAILMLSDENDCSFIESGGYYLGAQLQNAQKTENFHLPRPRGECATNASDPCCKSCGQSAAACPPDPTCFDGNGDIVRLTQLEDPANLRCFDQKRRFGIDFLYPIERYTMGLTSPVIPNRLGQLVPNPIFADVGSQGGVSAPRDAALVFLAGIVGVPWQDIARDPASLNAGFKSHDELNAKDANGMSAWDIILGDPATSKLPADPLMIESIYPRHGKNPVTGDPLKPPGDPTNAINGGERTIKSEDDLQYTCIFPLPQPRNCADPSIVSCDCGDPNNDDPLCAPDPVDSSKRTYQTRAKAYPGLRELALLRSLGEQGVVASACPAQLTGLDQTDFGYRPAIRALIERMKSHISGG